MPKTATVSLRGLSAYQAGNFFTSEKKPRETHDDFERRCWRERLHVYQGQAGIPPAAFQKAVIEAARMLKEPVPGRKGETYIKFFERGLLVLEPLLLGVAPEAVPGLPLRVPSDGRKGGGKRVLKFFPTIDQWGGNVQFHITHDLIAPDIFERHIREAGLFVGVGVYRPQSGGTNGRFAVEAVRWS